MVLDLGLLFGMRYDVFREVAIHITTHAKIFLWEFCTVSDVLLLLARYYIPYCMLHYTFSKMMQTRGNTF